jgi:tRNA pseudouridine55 synthase
MPERTVTVTRFEERWRDPPRVGLSVECSSGTYVRSLVADLGDAYCEELRRTAIGPFPDHGRRSGAPVPLGEALEQVLPVVRLEGDDAKRAGHGVGVQAPPARGCARARAARRRGRAIAVAVPREGGVLKPA